MGDVGDLPPGEGGLNPIGGYFFVWHSHAEKELTTFDIFPGGSLSAMVVLPPDVHDRLRGEQDNEKVQRHEEPISSRPRRWSPWRCWRGQPPRANFWLCAKAGLAQPAGRHHQRYHECRWRFRSGAYALDDDSDLGDGCGAGASQLPGPDRSR